MTFIKQNSLEVGRYTATCTLSPFLALTLSGLLRPCDWQLPKQNATPVRLASDGSWKLDIS